MRPEHTAPPEIFYNVDEAKKYSRNTRVMEIQVNLIFRKIIILAFWFIVRKHNNSQVNYLLTFNSQLNINIQQVYLSST